MCLYNVRMYVCIYTHMMSYTHKRQPCLSRRDTGHASISSIACVLRCVHTYIHTYVYLCVYIMHACMYVYTHMMSYTHKRQPCLSRRDTGHVSIPSLACVLSVYIHTYIHAMCLYNVGTYVCMYVCICTHDELYKQETAVFVKEGHRSCQHFFLSRVR